VYTKWAESDKTCKGVLCFLQFKNVFLGVVNKFTDRSDVVIHGQVSHVNCFS